MFENALLHFLHSVMVVVEHTFGVLYVQVVLGVFLPGQVEYRLQVVELYVVVGTLGIDALQLVQLVLECLAGILGHLLFLGLDAKVFRVAR